MLRSNKLSAVLHQQYRDCEVEMEPPEVPPTAEEFQEAYDAIYNALPATSEKERKIMMYSLIVDVIAQLEQ